MLDCPVYARQSESVSQSFLSAEVEQAAVERSTKRLRTVTCSANNIPSIFQDKDAEFFQMFFSEYLEEQSDQRALIFKAFLHFYQFFAYTDHSQPL